MEPARSPCCTTLCNVKSSDSVSWFARRGPSVDVPGQHRLIRCPKYELLLGNERQSARPLTQTGMHCTTQTREHSMTNSAERHELWTTCFGLIELTGS